MHRYVPQPAVCGLLPSPVPLAPPPPTDQQPAHGVRHPSRQRQENPEERKQDRDYGENGNHHWRVKRNQCKDLHGNSPRSPHDLAMRMPRIGMALWTYRRRSSDETGTCSRRAADRVWANTATWLPTTPLSAVSARRNGVRSNEFCRTPLVLATPKLARNQMFRARCVPNMYLFGTFSAQNSPEIAP